MHEVAPAAEEEYVPEGQLWHEETSDDPLVIEKVPKGHAVHNDAPAREYLPAKHWVHTEKLVAPLVEEYVPAGHSVQGENPVAE